LDNDYEINSKLCNKENKDLIYSISGKKYLNGILHYQLESESGQIYLSEFALKERFLQIDNNINNLKKPLVSSLYSKITDTVSRN
tara:strand:- start:255 stop:509 length:255 start_codon:yes stop_codon:yes gene_type:complete